MARPLRLLRGEAWYHVTARGNERREIFRTDQDGQIEVATNGRFLEVTTFTGRRWRLR